MIALAFNTWAKVLIACFGWAIAFCAFVWVKEGRAEKIAVSYYQEHGEHLVFGSPTLTFYAVEWITDLIVALLSATVTFGIRNLLF